MPTKAPALVVTASAACNISSPAAICRLTEGIENPLPTLNAIHDFSRQERGFAYLSTFLDPYTRLSLIAGTFTANFQIPNVPNAPTRARLARFGVTSFDSTKLNERQNEQTQYGVLALQRSVNGFDGQLSYFTRYNNLHFIPDPTGDLLFNGIASDVSRQSYTNGFQGDASYAINPAHTLRAGFTVSAEQVWVDNTSLVEAGSAARRRAAVPDHRRRAQDRLARRRLCARRVENHRQADDECRATLRPDVAICRGQSVEPAP